MKPYKPGLPLVTEFEDLIDSLPGRIRLAKLNTREVCKVAGIPRPTYYKQLKARSFTAQEVKTLLRTIAKLQRVPNDGSGDSGAASHAPPRVPYRILPPPRMPTLSHYPRLVRWRCRR